MKIQQIEKIDEGRYTIWSPTCECGSEFSLEISGEQLFSFHQGGLVHNVLPTTSPEDRERFLSGLCPTCWTDLFGVEEE